MPRTNLGKTFSGLVLAGLLALLAGCVPPSPPAPAARANLHNAQDNASLPPQSNAYPAAGNYGPSAPQNYTAAPAPGTPTSYPPTNSPPGNYPPQNYPQPNGYSQQPSTYAPTTSGTATAAPLSNGWTATSPAAYGTPATTTVTRYADPNVVPVGATGVAPAGPAPASPYDGVNAPSGPPPGYAGPSPSAPMTIGPVSASPKKSDEDDEWDISHLAPDYTWKKFKEAIGWGPDQRLAREAYDKGQALFNEALVNAKNHDEAAKVKNYEEAAKEFYTATWR
ncbi:MAG: hypothetical protein ABSG53_11380, partial [Thermoguttaceae bacterium]